MSTTTNIKIKAIGGNPATTGLFLDDNNPKLLPGEVVTVNADHPIFRESDENKALSMIEVTEEKANRKYKF